MLCIITVPIYNYSRDRDIDAPCRPTTTPWQATPPYSAIAYCIPVAMRATLSYFAGHALDQPES